MRKVTWAALALSALVALGCGAGASNNTASSSGGGDAKDDKPAAKIGEPVRDGKFEFTVKSMKCGVSTVGDKYVQEKAQGQFCLITLTVKNIGKEPQTLVDSAQKAYAADGTEYSTDSTAALYANKGENTIFTEINPGNQISGVLVFDIPKDVTLTKLELHDSIFSGGVEVALE
ncbi:MAG TPA: DUF4352 domain-containing protein [Micromonospora sp.]